MDINRENYESWFLDYLDGRLDAGQEEVLRAFLEYNPDLKEELEGTGRVSLDAEEIRYDLKLALRKPVQNPDRSFMLDHFEEYCLLDIEHQLNSPEEEMFRDILRDDERRQDTYRLYRSTLLKADDKIRYKGKSRLKKGPMRIPRFRIAVASAAAAVLVLIFVPLMLRHAGNKQVADRNTTPASVEKTRPEAEVYGQDGKHDPLPGINAEDRRQRPEDDMQQKGGKGFPDYEHGKMSAEHLPAAGRSKRLEVVSMNLVASIGTGPLVCSAEPDESLRAGFYDATLEDAGSSRNGFAGEETAGQDPSGRPERKFSFWRLANAGLRRLDELSDDHFGLEREIDTEGHTRRITFETPVFGVSAPMRSPGVPGK